MDNIRYGKLDATDEGYRSCKLANVMNLYAFRDMGIKLFLVAMVQVYAKDNVVLAIMRLRL